jgi:hypothetical protein
MGPAGIVSGAELDCTHAERLQFLDHLIEGKPRQQRCEYTNLHDLSPFPCDSAITSDKHNTVGPRATSSGHAGIFNYKMSMKRGWELDRLFRPRFSGQ